MSSLLEPFSGFIPAAEYAPRIVGPPSSMLTPEQKNASRDDELSFRHVVGRGARAPHAQALRWLERCRELDALQSFTSSVLVHRLTTGDHSAVGLIADVSLKAYDAERIKRHENTISKTQRKMLEYMQSTRIFGNPVALAHRNDAQVAEFLGLHSGGPVDLSFESIDGTRHEVWIVDGADARVLCDRFSDVLYITDGHHRLAAASLLVATENHPRAFIPAGLFAENQLQLGAFARTIVDSTVNPAAVLQALGDHFDLVKTDQQVPRPQLPHQFGLRIAEQSFLLTVPAARIPSDLYDRLDVNLLQDLILTPHFGVTDPRADPRLQFTADTDDASHQADAYDAWFLPYPTSVSDVMAVADTGRAMPPKSTYFMPKVPSGLVIRPVDVG